MRPSPSRKYAVELALISVIPVINIAKMRGARIMLGRVTVSLKVFDKYADIKTEDEING